MYIHYPHVGWNPPHRLRRSSTAGHPPPKRPWTAPTAPEFENEGCRLEKRYTLVVGGDLMVI